MTEELLLLVVMKQESLSYSAMPMKMAKQLCPEAIVIRGNSATIQSSLR